MSKVFSRRSIMNAIGGTAAAAGFFRPGTAVAKLKKDIEPRGSNGTLERLPTLDLDSYDDFSTATRIWINGDLTRASEQRAAEILKSHGVKPTDKVSFEDTVRWVADDPIIALRSASWQRLQWHMWQELRREFHGNFDAYMSELEAADASGPGVLELNPGIEPEYTKHEIHMQPGGYTGDPFAGHLYHYGTNNFYNGTNHQDQRHTALAGAVPVPADGKVRRILDMGCSCGQQVTALKQRFPDAEVWGIDIGAPMVRYAHMRAVDLGIDVNFRHALAEQTGFPDGHFDMVTSYILHHEVTAAASLQIVKEAHRILRPGGVFYPVDIYPSPTNRSDHGTAIRHVRDWMTHRWNHERWWNDYLTTDYIGEIARVGFTLQDAAREGVGYPMVAPGGPRNPLGIKPV
ncbi:MAG: class I SAM-dependent methyltransferase [Alphaproteobacteria bacterium]|nr:class I SAM-dependent methyltransferase [Alphaproteobacteria bacterium]